MGSTRPSHHVEVISLREGLSYEAVTNIQIVNNSLLHISGASLSITAWENHGGVEV
jgi:hypothetical protein